MEFQKKAILNFKIEIIFICEETIIKIKDKKTLRIFKFIKKYFFYKFLIGAIKKYY